MGEIIGVIGALAYLAYVVKRRRDPYKEEVQRNGKKIANATRKAARNRKAEELKNASH